MYITCADTMHKLDKEYLLRTVYDTAVYDTKISDNAECTVGIDYDELSEFNGKRIMKTVQRYTVLTI